MFLIAKQAMALTETGIACTGVTSTRALSQIHPEDWRPHGPGVWTAQLSSSPEALGSQRGRHMPVLLATQERGLHAETLVGAHGLTQTHDDGSVSRYTLGVTKQLVSPSGVETPYVPISGKSTIIQPTPNATKSLEFAHVVGSEGVLSPRTVVYSSDPKFTASEAAELHKAGWTSPEVDRHLIDNDSIRIEGGKGGTHIGVLKDGKNGMSKLISKTAGDGKKYPIVQHTDGNSYYLVPEESHKKLKDGLKKVLDAAAPGTEDHQASYYLYGNKKPVHVISVEYEHKHVVGSESEHRLTEIKAGDKVGSGSTAAVAGPPQVHTVLGDSVTISPLTGSN